MLSEQELSEYIPFAKAIALKFAMKLPSHIEKDELVSVAYVGLMKANINYKNVGSTFKSYAWQRIKGELLDYLRVVPGYIRSQHTMVEMVDGKSELLESGYYNSFEQASINEMAFQLNDVVSKLSAREELIVRMYFYEGKTMLEIAQHLGKCQARVSQLLNGAMPKLKAMLKHR